MTNKENNTKSRLKLLINNIDEFDSKFVTYKAESMKELLENTLEYIKNKEEEIKKYSNINEQDTKDFVILHNSFIEIEGLVKNFCEDCSEYERCDYEKDGCYYSILPRLKDIIKKVKESK